MMDSMMMAYHVSQGAVDEDVEEDDEDDVRSEAHTLSNGTRHQGGLSGQ